MQNIVINWLIENWVELAGFVFTVVYLILASGRNIWCWLSGALGTLLYVVVYYKSSLYGDVFLQIVYLAMSVYGWFSWKKAQDENQPILRLNLKQYIILILAIFLLFIGCGLILDNYTPSDVPWQNAVNTSLGIIGTWLLAKKYIENWWVWILADVYSIGLYATKSLYLTMVLYAIMTVLAFYAFLRWRKEMQNE